MKFTDEELSRILSAHAGGTLDRGGLTWPGPRLFDVCSRRYKNLLTIVRGCLLQVAKVNPSPEIGPLRIAKAFDSEYYSSWSSDDLLQWMESKGYA